MSIFVNLSTHFYSICSYLASGIKTTKDVAQWMAQVNYDIVALVLSGIHLISKIVFSTLEQILTYIKGIVTCMADFFNTIITFVDSFLSYCGEAVLGIYSSLFNLYTGITNVNSIVCELLLGGVTAIKMSVLTAYEKSMFALSWSVSSCVSVVMAVMLFFAAVGQFCIQIVTGAWYGLGFFISSVAYFPVYCFECIESLKNKAIDNVIHAFNSLPKETYLGIICLCLLYFTLSNIVRYLSGRGVKLFLWRLHSSRRRRPSFDWQLDRDFESDFEDLYGNEVEDDVWMIPTERGVVNRAQGNEADDATTISDDSDHSETIGDSDVSDSELDDDDEGSEDGYTVISDDSDDSDTSLNSQTLSIESSDHEIEVNLPTVDEGYSLRSRSSSPMSVPKLFSSHEDFEREMEKEKDKRKCVVCQDQIKSVLVMPCKHMCLCVLCADQLVRSRSVRQRVCPLCRTRMEKVMNVYV